MQPDYRVRITNPKHSFPHEPEVTTEEIRELEAELLPQIAELAENGSKTQRILVNRSRQALQLYKTMAQIMKEVRDGKL